MHDQPSLAGVFRLRRLLENDRLCSDLNAPKGTVTRAVAVFDVDGIHIQLFIPALAEHLGMVRPSASGRRTGSSWPVAGVTIIALCRKKFGEDAADDWTQEWQTRADDCYIAFCSSPVSGADIAIWIGGQCSSMYENG